MDIRIVIPGLPVATPDPFAVGLGGSETAGLQLGRAFARKGHGVTIFCQVAHATRWQGVRLEPSQSYIDSAAARAGDLLLIQRVPQLLALPHTAKAAFLWVHDLPQPSSVPALMAAMAAVDRLVTVSAWQAQQFQAVAPELAEEQMLVTRNGIDLELIAAGMRGAGERDPYRIVYSSRPERGLEVLLGDVFPRILVGEPRATLYLATYDCPAPAVEPYYRHLRMMAEPFGDRIVQHGALAKRELYRLMGGAGVFLYPTPTPSFPGFAETSCITAMEAMACGLPWVSTDAGALSETVGDAGVSVPLRGAAHAAAGDVPERLAAEALRVMHDPVHAERLRAAGLKRAGGFGWAGVADQLVAAAGEIGSATPSRPRPARSLKPVEDPAPVGAPRSKLVIATPTYSGVHPHFVNALLETHALLPRHGIEVEWVALAGVSLLSRARNNLAAIALAECGPSHILWIDSDISWQAEDVLRLMAHDVDFVVGLYPIKTLPGRSGARFAFQPLVSDDGKAPVDQVTGLLEVKAAGTGFMLTRCSVFVRMIQTYPETRITRGHDLGKSCPAALPFLHDFFPILMEDGELLSEDYGFCHRWRQLGGKVWADPSVQLVHHGALAYAGDPMRMFTASATATDPMPMAGAA